MGKTFKDTFDDYEEQASVKKDRKAARKAKAERREFETEQE